MYSYKIRKIIAFIRFLIFKHFFNECDARNFVYPNVQFRRMNRIFIGNNNTFYDHSSLIIDSIQKTQSIKIGNDNIIASYSILKSHGGYIEIGNNNFIGERTQIQGCGGVVIGNNCMIAPSSFVSSSNHDIRNPLDDSFLRNEIPRETIINDFVWIGANCVITAGVNIGHHVIIAAGSIITRSIKPYSMVAGNPGRIIKIFDKQEMKWIRV